MKNKFFLALLFVLGIVALTVTVKSVQQIAVFGNGFTLIQSGVSLNTATQGTNQVTFTTPYGVVPQVIVTPLGTATVLTNQVTAITTTNFNYTSGANVGSNSWVAFGSP